MKKILFGLLFVPALCFAKPLVDNSAQMDRAVDKFFQVYKRSGMAGVAGEIEKCYSNKKMDKLNFLYLDYTARIFDAQVTEVMGFPANEFFADSLFQERIATNVYFPRGVTMKQANKHLSDLYTKLIRRIDKRTR